MLSVTVAAADLQLAASWVSRLCLAKNADPVMQGIVLETVNDELHLSAYDYDTAGTSALPAVVRQPGRALVSGRLLAAVAKTLDGKKDVSFADDGSAVRFTAGRNVWTLPTLRLDDYPILPVPGEFAAKIDAAELRRAVQRILPAADRSNIEPLHGAVNLVSAGQRLCLVATDRYRLAVAEIDWSPVDEAAEIDLLVPTAFLDATFAALGPSSAAAEFGASSGVLYLATPSQRLVGRLRAGQWPSWRRVLPSPDAPVSAIFVVDDLATALGRAMAVAEDDEKTMLLHLSEDGIEIEAVAGPGTATAEAAVSEYNGIAKTVGFKPRFLSQALSVLDSDLAVLRTRDARDAPLDLVPLDDAGAPVTDYRHIVMPTDLRKRTAP